MRSTIILLLIPALLLTLPSSATAIWPTTVHEHLAIGAQPDLYEGWKQGLPLSNGRIFVYMFCDGPGGCYQIIDRWGNLVFPEARAMAPVMPQTDQNLGKLIPDGEGGVLYCWASNYGATYRGIWVQKVNSLGNRVWGETGIHASPVTHLALDANSDGEGGVLFAIKHENYVRAQRVDSSGQIMWADSGVYVCPHPTGQGNPYNIVHDGEGGAFVIWCDYRDPYWYGAMFAQHVDAGGEITWASGGLHIGGSWSWAQLRPDGAGGFLMNTDCGASGNDNKLYRINSEGEILWERLNVSWEGFPGFVEGEPGHFYLVYPYFPTFLTYMQCIDATGQMRWPPPGVQVTSDPNLGNDGIDLVYDNGYLLTVFEAYNTASYFPRYHYAQKLDTAGHCYWGRDGIMLSFITTGAYIDLPVAVSDGFGGVVALFHHFYDLDQSNVWGKHVTSEGELGGASCPPWLDQTPGELSLVVSQGQLRYTVPVPGEVTIDMFNLLGQRVKTITDGYFSAGTQAVHFDDQGLAAGVYFIRLKTDGGQAVKKVVVVR